MKRLIPLLISALLFAACEEPKVSRKSAADKVDDWLNVPCFVDYKDLPQRHQTYLSVYSLVYHRTEKRQYNLSVTVSVRNTSSNEDLVLHAIDYYNGEGEKIRAYITDPVCLGPMVSREIIINAPDVEGGVGGNFIFDWHMKNEDTKPIFEAVMISTAGQQGLSFVTTGIHLN
jgi:hypothetical protein